VRARAYPKGDFEKAKQFLIDASKAGNTNAINATVDRAEQIYRAGREKGAA
jgi:TPR repeat protein